MNSTFWQAKWQRNEIGFHEHRPNVLLVRNFPALCLQHGARVFVPLCGKSLDIHWLLAQGHQVVGCELSHLPSGNFLPNWGWPRMYPSVARCNVMMRKGYVFMSGIYST